MQTTYYIGLDVHKKKISHCVKDVTGRIHSEGAVAATRIDLDLWMKLFLNRGLQRWKCRSSRDGSTAQRKDSN